MDLDLTSEQTTLMASVSSMLSRYRQLPQPAAPDYLVYGADMDAELESAGFYGDADGFALEPAEATLVLEEIARCPFAVPAMASLVVAPALGLTLPRPFALLQSPEAPARFLAEAKTALIVDGDEVLALDLAAARVEPLKTIFAYPYGRLAEYDRSAAMPIEEVASAALLQAWRLGLIFEILGALRAAHALTVDYSKQRVQFKRAIGSFQAVQHRLGEGATHIEALHYLGRRAAWSGDAADTAVAACYAQKVIGQIVYDCHQFHGAMGLTLEYVLHHWTYRLKVLAGELGGSSAQGRAAALAIWGEAA